MGELGAGQIDAAHNAILALKGKTDARTRVLLLERDYRKDDHWVKILRGTNSQASMLEEAYYKTPSITPRRLEALSDEHFITIMKDYSERYPTAKDGSQPPTEGQWRCVLEKLPQNDYRPLFAAFAGEAVAEQSIDQVRNWNATQLTEQILSKEFNRWESANVDAKHANLFALATMVGGLEKQTAWKLAAQQAALPSRTEIQTEMLSALGSYSLSTDKDKYRGFEPDILGELYILKRMDNEYQIGPGDGTGAQDTCCLIRLAWQFFPLEMAWFAARCAQDFPEHAELLTLFEHVPEDAKSSWSYAFAEAFAAVELIRVGQRDKSDQLLAKLPPEVKAKALYSRGMMYGKLGETKKAIEDYTQVIEMPDASAEQKAKALYNRGVAYGELGETKKAIEDYTRVIEMPDASAEQKAKALTNRGATYGELGETEKKIGDYTRVIEMPDAPEIAKQLAREELRTIGRDCAAADE